ncbi:ABC transporter ATP-binding protein [Paraburkholderia caballeronis]|uniref:ABC transporter ATP-binding protein n=1 Tax=Paraburkholderia caballeronis TaxID=416943 RepID=UPI0010657E46|nr:ABC transporter ATP-binding protein [Paraburkholderia caballeronis]TDV01691.1 iron(III) transport system ATP-binding protein [Paraburkholderia caballeronis]TDV06173.1 iron(III) transport system ATP-binding protein [Paraburkholderia caballeronis]TDV16080.1 iron(III) transport system ATP-binding protein [Paraburkholderia caballeronis]
MSAFQITGLHKSFDGHAVLEDIDLAVKAGTLLALLGPSGSGKTTLLRVLCGFERADAGTVEIGGRLVAGDGLHLPPERRRIGYVPQEGALFPHLSVADNIVFGLPRARRHARHRVAELLELVGLPASYAERAPQQLSGGQQQRVALARALAPEPGVVMLDEPFSSLDAALRADTRQAVTGALAASGATAILVTHDQEEALSLGDEVAVLWQGRLLQTAAPQSLYRRPATRELASFVGDAMLLPGTMAGNHVRCALGSLPLVGSSASSGEPTGDVDVMVRPEQIRILPRGENRLPAPDDAIEARVRRVTFLGRDAAVTLQLAGFPETLIRARVSGLEMPSEGASVAIAVAGPVCVYPAE